MDQPDESEPAPALAGLDEQEPHHVMSEAAWSRLKAEMAQQQK